MRPILLPDDLLVTIYLDNHATTRCDPRVVAAMLPFFSEDYGNAGSVGHGFGERAREAVDRSRQQIAAAIGASADEVVFTSGATESNNLAIRGVAERPRRRGDHLVSVQTEHRAVLDPLARLAARGWRVTLLGVEQHGLPLAGWLDPQKVAEAIQDDTCLVSVMLAGNEIGVVQPIAEIAAVCRARGVLLHCDATQAVGKIPVDVRSLGVDLMSFTAHKLYGPKGIGALYARGRDPVVRLEPQIFGGGQQGGRRSGTLNVPGIVGFAAAVGLCVEELESEAARQGALRDRLADAVLGSIAGAELCGPALDAKTPSGAPARLPNNLNVAFGDVDGESLMLAMPQLAVSSGAACSSTDPEPSHVLRALGLSPEQARATLRIGLGRFTTAEEVETAAALIPQAVAKLRGMGRT
ncbi:Cysteine desulfurase [Pirellulimonas nuda]|uniref:cysteine desulfurase n=1 Tax=Pirellulimonas nuda TaxID=2528009 RepID=A0A518DF32_9BACT|nr:cysteine desulfurase family protein [Pirellulimonas nuda]QDU90095.1 Cysteine desulfurase [Pirellulimonas nuda]